MDFVFEGRQSDSPLVESLWRTQSERAGSFISSATSHWEMVIWQDEGKAHLSVRGPETQATPAESPEGVEFFGIIFKHGAFMPNLPTLKLVNDAIHLPESADKSFWFQGASWQVPTFENADTFVKRLIHDGLLAYDPVIQAALDNQAQDVSIRTVRRHFLRATGLTHGAIVQIERARQAATLLEKGTSILDAVEEAGYFDQPHLTRSLKRFMGKTPAQIALPNPPE